MEQQQREAVARLRATGLGDDSICVTDDNLRAIYTDEHKLMEDLMLVARQYLAETALDGQEPIARAKDTLQVLGLQANERGNIWLVNDDLTGHNAWLRLAADNLWLEIDIRTDNYPGLNVNTIVATEAELARHIHNQCVGMYARKCNIAGITLDDENYIDHVPEESDDDTDA